MFVSKNSSSLAPYRTHTIHSIQSILTPDIRQKLVKEFKPLANLGNTYPPQIRITR
ncbi:MAG: hypothetical protein P4M11_06775 [Candidatus Pacebacteria bacterium]|nr:hypothetical protein [Candidatus Paceibacterota bacterium]